MYGFHGIKRYWKNSASIEKWMKSLQKYSENFFKIEIACHLKIYLSNPIQLSLELDHPSNGTYKEFNTIGIDSFTLICADGAVTALLEEGIIPDIVVTDLDGKIEDIIDSNRNGTVMVVHAHGNNMENIKKYVPVLDNILATTQSKPLKKVYNFGGFTDGDRCLFLAIKLGAKNIFLAGMDFGKIITRYSRPDIAENEGKADNIKEMKLKYAKKLVEWAAENENVNIFNLSHGEKVLGVPDINFGEVHNHTQQ